MALYTAYKPEVSGSDSLLPVTNGETMESNNSGFWGKDPINTLSRSYFISPEFHTKFRYFSAFFHVAVLVWASCLTNNVFSFFAFLTFWGFGIVTAYFCLVNFVKFSDSNTLGWKIVYVLGEIGATLEFLICPFFFVFLFPEMLQQGLSLQLALLNICLHLFCAVFIWIETICNAIQFSMKHFSIIIVFMVIYPINNFIWSEYIFKHPVYPVISWHDVASFIFMGIAIALGSAGYFVGNYQFNKKQQKPFKTAESKVSS